MKNWLFGVVFLFVCNVYGQISSHVKVKVSLSDQRLVKTEQESLFIEYMKIKEGTWIQFNLEHENKLIDSDVSVLQIRAKANNISKFFESEGLLSKHVSIKYSPTPNVVIYKPFYFVKKANFVQRNPNDVQIFYVSASEGGVCETKAGNRINFAPNAFVGATPDADVEVKVWEYSNTNSFVKSGYTSTSNGSQIASNGMYYIEAFDQKKKLELNPNADCNIQFAKENVNPEINNDEFLTFYGDENDEIVDWKPSFNEPINNRSKNDLTTSVGNLKPSRKSKRIVVSTEIHYVQLCKNLPLVDPKYRTEANSEIGYYNEERFVCGYTAKDFADINSTYGVYQRKNSDMVAITSSAEFEKMQETNPNNIFIALGPEEAKDLKAKKKAFKEGREKKVKEEIAKREKEREEARKEAMLDARGITKEELEKFPLEMKISQLGQINCDRFYNEKKTIDVIVKLDDFQFDQIRVYAVFMDIKSVIPAEYVEGSTMGMVKFSDLPQNKEVLYVASLFKDGQIRLGYINQKKNNKDVLQIVTNAMDKNKYEAIINDLIPI